MAERFIKYAKVLEKMSDQKMKEAADKQDDFWYNHYLNESLSFSRESAQLKRTSMDLTHTLADLRLNR